MYADIIAVTYLYICLDKGKFLHKDDFKFQSSFVLSTDVLESLH